MDEGIVKTVVKGNNYWWFWCQIVNIHVTDATIFLVVSNTSCHIWEWIDLFYLFFIIFNAQKIFLFSIVHVENCCLSNDIYDYVNVSQGKTTIPNVNDAEEFSLTDVSNDATNPKFVMSLFLFKIVNCRPQSNYLSW